jgi:hypothetical protein
MEAEDLVDSFGESVNGSGAQMIRLRTTLCCKFRQILYVILQVKENLYIFLPKINFTYTCTVRSKHSILPQFFRLHHSVLHDSRRQRILCLAEFQNSAAV